MSRAFHEVQFPPDISYGAVGGPGFRTTVFTRNSGKEDRNIDWSKARAMYDVSKGIRTQEEMDATRAFFYARRAKAFSFRFKDWTDWKSCAATRQHTALDQILGVGNGVNKVFQLTKTYPDTVNPYIRQINKPVANSVLVAVNGVAVSVGIDYTVNNTNGIVTLTVAPASGITVSAGYQFDVPCRFDTDIMQITLEDFNVSSWGQIAIVEDKL